MNRKNESGRPPMRTDRFFAVNSSWYFDSRERMSIGPYETKKDAIQGLSDFIEFIQLINKNGKTSYVL